MMNYCPISTLLFLVFLMMLAVNNTGAVPIIASPEQFSIANVCCIGAGYVGGPTSAVIADFWPEITVNVVDLNAERIASWNSQKLPIHENGLEEIVFRCRGKNLHFSCKVEEAIAQADAIFVCVNTPTKERGIGEGMASNMAFFEQAIRTIAKFATGKTLIIEKSTVPCKTASIIENTLKTIPNPSQKLEFQILSNPEFLAEGTAVHDLLNAERILIGGMQTPEGLAAIGQLAHIYSRWIPRERIITVNLWSSELAKLAANAFLAQRISSINSLTPICEAIGADIQEISRVIGLDSRIGAQFLKPSIGFGGSCFRKDILNLVYLCTSLGLSEVAEYWLQVLKLNDYQKNRFVKNIIHKMNGTISLKKIAILGFAFKKGTSDTRESPAIGIVAELAKEGGKIAIYDPLVAKEQVLSDLQAAKCPMQGISWQSDLDAACEDAEALVILTECDEFATVNYQQIWQRMKKPAFIFDGRIVLANQESALEAIGFRYECLGK